MPNFGLLLLSTTRTSATVDFPAKMLLRSHIHLLVDAVNFPVHISHENPGHLVVVTFIRQSKRTDVEIEFHRFEGGVKATSFVCLLGIGIGFSSYLVYKLYAHLLPRWQIHLSALMSKLRHKHQSSKLQVVSVESSSHSAVAATDLLLTKACSACSENCTSEKSFSYNISPSGSENVLRSDQVRPHHAAKVTTWLMNNHSPYATTAVGLVNRRREKMRCRSLESSRNRDVGLPSFNLVNSSGFYAQNFDQEPDKLNKAKANKHQGQVNDGLTPRDKDKVFSFLDVSNNNLSSVTESDCLSAASRSRSCLDGSAFHDKKSLQRNRAKRPLSYSAVENARFRFHSTPDYIVTDHDRSFYDRKSAANGCKAAGMKSSKDRRHGCRGNPIFDQKEVKHSHGFINQFLDSSSWVESSDSEVFEAETSSLGKETLSDMERLHSQLKIIHEDIDDLNEQMETLQTRENPKTVVALRYTLGTSEALTYSGVSPGVASRQTGKVPKIITETLDFTCDSPYDSNVNQKMKEAVMGLDPNNACSPLSLTSSGSLNSDYSLGEDENEHLSERNDRRAEHPVLPRTNDMYIDDDLSGLELSESEGLLERYQKLCSSLDNEPCIAPPTDWRFLFPNLLDFQLTAMTSADTEKETVNGNETDRNYTCVNCGGNVNIINNNLNISKNHPVLNSEAVCHAAVDSACPTSSQNGSRVQYPKFTIDVGPLHLSAYDGCDAAASFAANLPSQWEVENVGEKGCLLQYLECSLRRRESKWRPLLEGYHEIRKLFGVKYVRPVRGDNFCALRTVLFQVLINNLAITNFIGNFQDSLQRLNVFSSPQHCYLKSWNFANRLPYERGMVLEKLKECLTCLHHQIEVLSRMTTLAEREQYLITLLNHFPEVDLKFLEAVKILMMIKAIDLFSQLSRSRFSVPVFAWLMFNRSSTENPEMLFYNRINPLGDSLHLQKSEMHLLGSTLGIKIEVIRPDRFEAEDFIAHYPDEGADLFEKVSIIEEEDGRYSIMTV